MKKLLVILSLMLLAGCESEAPPKEIKKTSNEDTNVFIDETGCEYLYREWSNGYAGAGGMTVRLDEYGKPKGCKKINQNQITGG
ncbi:DUF6440 family protein [Bacillus cereus group sp. BfR-BA-00999]|uniref:DUF6440 family protein n=1 Tax=Bacillus cereus group sp. BfR-BA-00999 TaxID=3094871 RepID=UPI0029C104ED|nr:DUF6440 family protein [Bacillus cereus group sp. BfR-BA-00999]MDX5884964.1 DUF6440 family protein [Bacillus cereus group sp. BfR-BA-00999]